MVMMKEEDEKTEKVWVDGEVLHPHCSKKRNGHQAFRHTHCILGKSVFHFKNVKKGPIQGSIGFKSVPGPLSKVPFLWWGRNQS
jgi:hypothetical protein